MQAASEVERRFGLDLEVFVFVVVHIHSFSKLHCTMSRAVSYCLPPHIFSALGISC